MTGPARFTISEVAVDWQEPMVLQRKLRPSNCRRRPGLSAIGGGGVSISFRQ